MSSRLFIFELLAPQVLSFVGKKERKKRNAKEKEGEKREGREREGKTES